jgi:glycosyltransferase involved in cell wall biosynthesis
MSAKNAEDTIAETIESITKIDYSLNKIELLISNGCSTDNTLKQAEKFQNSFRRFEIVTEKHKNLADGWNKVLPLAKGDYIALVSPDMILPKDWPNLIEHLKQDIGGVCPRVINYRDPGFLTNFWSLFKPPEKVTEWREIDSAASIFKKQAVPSKFDDRIFRSEDADFSIRVRKKGFRLLCDPSVKVIHAHRRTLRQELYRYYVYGISSPYIQMKHKDILPWRPFLRRLILTTSLPISIIMTILQPLLWPLFVLAVIGNLAFYFVRMKKTITMPIYALFGTFSHFIMGIGYIVGLGKWLTKRF